MGASAGPRSRLLRLPSRLCCRRRRGLRSATGRSPSAVTVLSAGRTVARAASEARGTFPNVDDTTPPTTRRRLCPADEQPQCRVVRALRLALGQRVTLDRPEPRATPGIDDRDNDLQAAGRVEHDPVKHGTAAGDVHEVAYSVFLHNPEPIAPQARAPGLQGHHQVGRDSDAKPRGRYCGLIDDTRQRPRPTARDLARAVDGGRHISAALRHLDVHASDPEAQRVADALARFLVARCDSHHAGWRVVRQVIVDSAADAPWEKCARRAVPMVADGSHRPCWDRRADPAASRPAHRRSAASRTDRLPRRSARRPHRSRAEMRCNDTRPLARGAQFCRQGSLARSKSRAGRGSLFAGWLIDSAAR